MGSRVFAAVGQAVSPAVFKYFTPFEEVVAGTK